MQKLAVILLCGWAASVLWLFSPRCVFACSCVAPGPPKVELAQSVGVFAGRVIDIEKPSGTVMSSADPVIVTLQVSTVWKILLANSDSGDLRPTSELLQR